MPLEARYTLKAEIPAGTWQLVGDGQIYWPCDIRFDLGWRDAGGGAEHAIGSLQHHFDPPPLGPMRFYAVPFAAEFSGEHAAAAAGDELVLHIVVESADGEPAYLPNGTGDATGGQIPNLLLP
jgi:hypothetical protein